MLIWLVILVLTVLYGIYLVIRFVVSHPRAMVAVLALAVIVLVIVGGALR